MIYMEGVDPLAEVKIEETHYQVNQEPEETHHEEGAGSRKHLPKNQLTYRSIASKRG